VCVVLRPDGTTLHAAPNREERATLGPLTFRHSTPASSPAHNTSSSPVALQTDEAHLPATHVAGAARGLSPCGGATTGR
jgi:hypothetical protein